MRYKLKELKKLLYDSEVRCLIEDKSYKPETFELEENQMDFIQNYLLIDIVFND